LSRIVSVTHSSWLEPASPAVSSVATAALEGGAVLFLPQLSFTVESRNADIFSPAILSSSKNASFDPISRKVGGTSLTGASLDRVRQVMEAFSERAAALVEAALPSYRGQVVRARASFRPAEIAGRSSSWRKDDTRLHIDSFPATPVQGRRILRVFSNVNPSGRPRSWRIGPAFAGVAERFAATLSMPLPGTGALLQLLKVTKTRRTAYDALMLQLHDRMKEDAAFQEGAEQERIEFPSGSTWMAFTDQVSHAAMAGQYQFEQTFLLPVQAMIDPAASPLRLLERIKGRRLT
jgi:hypothetical protein